MNFAVAAASNPQGAPSAVVTDLEHRKLADAAQQFEGMLLQELLKPMREYGFCQDNQQSGNQEDSGGDTLTSFGAEVMATAIAKGGGLGIAQRVVAQVGEKLSYEKGTGRSPGTLTLPK